MSELRLDEWTMPAADLGPENPLPPLQAVREIHEIEDAPGVPDEMVANMRYGRVGTPLPYTVQDRYNRQLQPRTFRTAVLENDLLRATFLLEMGGRLWSLVHKSSGRELLSVNPIFQPANLAIRNAWFSGGVEWNIGTIGHCPFTCSPIFAAQAETADGTPVLRLYEWERIRRVPFQIDAWLPDGSPVLYVHVRIHNLHDETIPMYWWSNMAVPETPETRVVVPADRAYSFGYKRGTMRVVDVPQVDGQEVSYTVNMNRSADFFFHIEDGHRPWITALDAEGRGLVQTSTRRLQGRKLFMWGSGPGGKRWQSFLSRPGTTYLEIQAGLARTQAEHVPMPAGSEWRWLEAYGLMEADPAVVHGPDWRAAGQAVGSRLEALLPQKSMNRVCDEAITWLDQAPRTIEQHGSGWGALEQIRLETTGEPTSLPQATPFPAESLGEAQTPWLTLAQEGRFPELDPETEPVAYLVQPEWREILERYDACLSDGDAVGWGAWYYLGVMRHWAGEIEVAADAWRRSLDERVTPWALRNLAVVHEETGELDQAAEDYVAACRLRPSLVPLVAECGAFLVENDHAQAWLDLLADLPASVSQAGRIRLLQGRAALAIGDFAQVESLFADPPMVDDLREGERSLSQLWFEFHEQRISAEEGRPVDERLRVGVRRDHPVPPEIDFRMSADPAGPAE